ncbi:short chain dehydrogenase reductase [Tricladium varicosporioides]|nr:short chain dehydrogenase reductase [Hymenoscyphus varicosporioides]
MTNFTKDSTATEVADAFAAHITGKVVLITGSSPNGLGIAAAMAMAVHKPALLILAGRTRSLIDEAEKAILAKAPSVKTRILLFDFANLKSVREGAAEVNKYPEQIDVLINNAGIMAIPTLQKTADGFESTLGVNHLGPFLFTKLIIGKIPRGGRIVNISSGAYEMGPFRFDDPNFETGPYDKWQAYAQSKVANILFSQCLAEKFGPKGIFSFSLHVGGGIYTNLGKHLTPEDLEMLSHVNILTQDQGASSYIAAAFDPELEAHNGTLVGFCKPEPIKEECSWAQGKENRDRLWSLSEKLVEEKFEA